MLDRTLHTPPYAQVEAVLAAEAAAWPDITKVFHSETAVAARFGVSRMTARRALEGLASRGLLRREHGRGSYVTALRLVEAFTPTMKVDRGWRAMGLDVQIRVLHFDRVQPADDVLWRLGLRSGAQVLHIRRVRTVSGEPVALDDRWITSRVADAAALVPEDAAGSVLDALWRAGPLAHADWEVEARPAAPEEAALLAIAPGAPVLLRTMRYTTPTGDVAAVGTSMHRADRMRYALRLPLHPPGSAEPAHAVPEIVNSV